jgi:outer membrane lipoprotein-sorting protein
MKRRVGLVAVLLMGFGAAAMADELEAAQKRIVEAWNKQKSFTAKVETTQRVELGDTVMEGKSTGTLEVQREGDKVRMYTEQKISMTTKTGKEETKMEQSSTTVMDGEFVYTLSDTGGQKSATKMKYSPLMTGDPKATFEDFTKQKYTVKLLPEETVSGRKAFVMEVTPSQPDQGPMGLGKMRYCFDQESGILLQMVTLGVDNKPMMTTTYSDLKLDAKIDPQHFKFTPPAGVKVVDQTTAKP